MYTYSRTFAKLCRSPESTLCGQFQTPVSWSPLLHTCMLWFQFLFGETFCESDFFSTFSFGLYNHVAMNLNLKIENLKPKSNWKHRIRMQSCIITNSPLYKMPVNFNIFTCILWALFLLSNSQMDCQGVIKFEKSWLINQPKHANTATSHCSKPLWVFSSALQMLVAAGSHKWQSQELQCKLTRVKNHECGNGVLPPSMRLFTMGIWRSLKIKLWSRRSLQ